MMNKNIIKKDNKRSFTHVIEEKHKLEVLKNKLIQNLDLLKIEEKNLNKFIDEFKSNY